MSLAVDFTTIPRLSKGEFRLPAGEFLPTTPLRARGESGHQAPDGVEFQPSYRVPDCVEALCSAFRRPLSGMLAPGFAQ